MIKSIFLSVNSIIWLSLLPPAVLLGTRISPTLEDNFMEIQSYCWCWSVLIRWLWNGRNVLDRHFIWIKIARKCHKMNWLEAISTSNFVSHCDNSMTLLRFCTSPCISTWLRNRQASIHVHKIWLLLKQEVFDVWLLKDIEDNREKIGERSKNRIFTAIKSTNPKMFNRRKISGNCRILLFPAIFLHNLYVKKKVYLVPHFHFKII